jgi:hypothetical protein
VANVLKMSERYGKEEFKFIPDSYILPDEFADLTGSVYGRHL